MANGSLISSPGPGLGSMAVGAMFVTLGLALAFDYRGLTTKHVEMTLRITPTMRRRTPVAVETRRLRQIALEKVIGGVFAVFGVGAFGLGLIGLIGWAVK